LTIYLDASVLFSVVHEDAHSERVSAWLVQLDDFAFSRWTVAEVSSALGVQARARRLPADVRQELELELDKWLVGRPVCAFVDADLVQARQLVRDDVRLRTPDALHVAVALRNGYQLATLDADMAAAARALGLEVVVP
jgi:hypothetical protein